MPLRQAARQAGSKNTASTMSEAHDMHIKLLMLGDTAVGKTCLLVRYAYDSFSSTFITTIGIDFKVKNVDIEGKRVKLQIWDTAGQERFRTITLNYFRGAHGILLVYDVTDRETFDSIQHWVAQIKEHADAEVNVILIGNKVDLGDDKRQVSTEEGAALAREYNLQFFETSAKSNDNVDEAFQAIAQETKTRLEKEVASQSAAREVQADTVKPSAHGSGGQKGKGKCC